MNFRVMFNSQNLNDTSIGSSAKFTKLEVASLMNRKGSLKCQYGLFYQTFRLVLDPKSKIWRSSQDNLEVPTLSKKYASLLS